MGQSIELTRSALDNGNLLRAYDIAATAIEKGDTSTELRHLIVLALARMGDAEKAMDLYHQYELDKSLDAHHRAIVARILKDTALEMQEEKDRNAGLLAAFSAYEEIYLESEDAYPGINAATLAFLGGRKNKAKSIAASILKLPEIAEPSDYYAAATKAEALLINGAAGEASIVLSTASNLPGGNSGAKSSSSKQLSLVAREAGLSAEQIKTLLAPIAPPAVIHYCGHMFLEDIGIEAELRTKIDAYLDANDVGFAYGALAAGSDILIAEAVLARGGKLHVTFPFVKEDFIAQSVTPAGNGWLQRFEKCLTNSTSVNFVTKMNYVGDPAQFGYASKAIMGMAKLRGQFLGISAKQLAIWDGKNSTGPAGTGADVEVWNGYGGVSTIIDAEKMNRNLNWPAKPTDDPHKRTVAAILFTDFPGFSKFSEAVLPAFWNGIMGGMASVLKKHEENVLAQNSWGDALLAAMPNTVCAAEIALELHSALQNFDYSTLGLAESSGMRIGLHYGPAYETEDPITGKTTFYGTEVSRAARIEPVTPPGAVFVTEPFAAILALEAPEKYICRYVGNIEFAKNYGTYPIYRLAAVAV